jgi:thiamine transport system ATP-binding protein
MVTHHPEDAKRFAEDVVFVADGVVRAAQAVNTFFASTDAAVTDYLT